METLISSCVLRRLIWVCTVCQCPFQGSPHYNGLNRCLCICPLSLCLSLSLSLSVFKIIWAASCQNVPSSICKMRIHIILRMRKVSSGRFAPQTNILKYPMFVSADCECPDQSAHSCCRIWSLAVRICSKTRFSMAPSILFVVLFIFFL